MNVDMACVRSIRAQGLGSQGEALTLVLTPLHAFSWSLLAGAEPDHWAGEGTQPGLGGDAQPPGTMTQDAVLPVL